MSHDRQTVLAMGTFDLLHPGHLRLFSRCRELAGPDGRVVATVNSDKFVTEFKGRAPVMGEWDRATMVGAVHWVDRCFVHRHGFDAKPTIRWVEPQVLVVGSDWADRDYLGQLGVTQAWLGERGIVVDYVPLLAGQSSTALREGLAA